MVACIIFGKISTLLISHFQTRVSEAGCDEAGRGCFAGPVFAAAVILPSGFFHPNLNDSKQVPEPMRNALRVFIEAHATDYAVAQVDSEEIDRINILQASFKAMHLAIGQLRRKPGLLLIDGHLFNAYGHTRHRCIIQGDAKYASIAAASILAKTYRDQYMRQLHEEFPQYGWISNKGYGTPEHRRGIEAHGICKHHRKSFRILDPPAQLLENPD